MLFIIKYWNQKWIIVRIFTYFNWNTFLEVYINIKIKQIPFYKTCHRSSLCLII